MKKIVNDFARFASYGAAIAALVGACTPSPAAPTREEIAASATLAEELAECRIIALGTDAGPDARWAVYASCADVAERAAEAAAKIDGGHR